MCSYIFFKIFLKIFNKFTIKQLYKAKIESVANCFLHYGSKK